MADDSHLAGLDPFDILDHEAARLEAYYAEIAPAELQRESRCEDWSVRDVLAHLSFGEDYFRACLDDGVGAFMGALGARGATDLESANALGIADRANLSTDELLAQWREASAENRRRFRERGDGTVDTSVGQYSAQWQAFHIASELATHADDVYLPETDDERPARRHWRSRFSRFALTESKPDAKVTVDGDLTRVAWPEGEVALDDGELIEAAAGRLDDSSRLDAAARKALNTVG
jgi:uncharacterized protein (TIGR03083 family)